MQFLKSKTALITGGTAGIGRAIALLFVKEGADVAIMGTHEERGQAVVREMESLCIDSSQRVRFFRCDVAKTNEVEQVVSELLKDWGKVDLLVNNAGITRDNLLMRMTEEEWDSVVTTNLKSVYNTCRVLARPMTKARSGRIINISSVVGLMGNAGQVNYAASKSGVIGFSKSLAKELASRGILVNCVAPGYIETQMTQGLPEAVKEKILSEIPLARIGRPEDIAHAVLFLASDLSSYITGQVLTVDGGMIM
jgi:3-oxoacyl-[acyl-carrier protein] reductase